MYWVLRTLVISLSDVQQNATLTNMPVGLGKPSLSAIIIKEII